ncbi:MAG: DUF1127 domain-containing protein [Pikeienuella sp.]
MAVEIKTRSLPLGALTIHRTVNAVIDLAESIAEWNRARNTASQLTRLSPHSLHDIGLTQADVERFARTGRW